MAICGESPLILGTHSLADSTDLRYMNWCLSCPEKNPTSAASAAVGSKLGNLVVKIDLEGTCLLSSISSRIN